MDDDVVKSTERVSSESPLPVYQTLYLVISMGLCDLFSVHQLQ